MAVTGYSISIGIESGDEFVLKNIIKKQIMLSMVKPIISKAKELGLETTAFFVAGFPGENCESLKKTFHFAENIKVDNVNFFFATPLPGTRLFQLCKEKGLINNGIDYKRLKPDYPSFSNEIYSIHKLNSIVIKQRIKMHLLYFLKNPLKFIGKIYNKLLNDPGYIF